MGLELKVSQVQKISQNMIQQVNVLQMSSQELNAYVKELSMENPIMELDEPEPDNQDKERLRKLEWLSDIGSAAWMNRIGFIIARSRKSQGKMRLQTEESRGRRLLTH